MKNNFVPYEQALKLKELGFDEPCFGFYVSFYSGGTPHLQTEWLEEYLDYDFFIPAPLWQQAFDWFREKHNLDSEFYMNHEYGNKFYTYLILQLDRSVISHKSGSCERFKLYIEAQLSCLDKLIKIIEQLNK